MNSVGGLRQARDRGCEFLLNQQRADGGFGLPERGLADYYKVVSAYQCCGATREASRLCDWIRTHGMTREGDFGPRLPEAEGYSYAYYNTWVIIGAHRLGQFDICQRGFDYLATFRDAESGGFYSSLSERADSTEQDLWVVAGCGQAALYTGHLEVAEGVGHWMRRLMAAQPDYPRKLYGVFSRAEGLRVNYDPKDEIRYVLTNDAGRDQYFFNPGIAAGFLARLYLATGRLEWLELAKEYMRFAECANDALFKSVRAGKVGWAAGLLYSLTGEERYRRIAARVASNLVASQSEDGSWPVGFMSTNDVTAEMVVWLDEIHQALD